MENITLSNNWTTSEPPDISQPALAALLAVQILVLILGVTLNIGNITVLVRGRKFGRRMRIQLINLAVADMLTALFIPGSSPAEEYVSLRHFPNSPALCKLYQFMSYSSFYASLLCHTAIALERLVATCFPFLMTRYKRRHVVAVVGLIWAVAYLSTINIISISSVIPRGDGNICYANVFPEGKLKRSIAYYSVKFLLPSFVIAITYTVIGFRLRAKKIIGSKTAAKSRVKTKEVLAMLAVNAILAFLIWLPYFIFLVVQGLKESRKDSLSTPGGDKVAITLYGIDYMNCFITPIVYLLLNSDYRKDAKQVLLAKCIDNGEYDKTNSRDVTTPLDSVSNIQPRKVQQNQVTC